MLKTELVSHRRFTSWTKCPKIMIVISNISGVKSLKEIKRVEVDTIVKEIDVETLEKLAEAAHKVWMEGKLRDGWKYGPVTDKTSKTHNCLVPYNELTEADKESDRDMVRGIPRILAAAGYGMVESEKLDKEP